MTTNDDPRFRNSGPRDNVTDRGARRRDRNERRDTGHRPPRPPAARRPAPPPPELGPPGTERLQKVLADAGIASRRDCEMLVFEGRVRVNGRTIRELPCWVRADNDLIEVDGETLKARVSTEPRAPRARERLYLMLHKPKGVITTAHDPEGRANVVGLVSRAVPPGERVYPVGRLDADSTGLVLLTNDGELTARLTHPRFGVAKTYVVAVNGQVTPESLEVLKRGMFLASPDSIARSKAGGGGAGARRAALESVRILDRRIDRSRGGSAVLSITLREGQNREIRRLLARVGLKVRRLERVAVGDVKLGSLPYGAFRALRADEVARLRAAAGLDADGITAARREPRQASRRPVAPGSSAAQPRPASARRGPRPRRPA
jgi:23S rRNA pseudouridine2605 synthase